MEREPALEGATRAARAALSVTVTVTQPQTLTLALALTLAPTPTLTLTNNQVPTVSRSQCKVNLYADGQAVLTSQGSCAPTLVRSQGGAWIPIYADQTHYLTSGDQISLDASNPEGAVFTCQNEAGGAGQQQGQQGGYGQQQQGGYGQQQGGYY